MNMDCPIGVFQREEDMKYYVAEVIDNEVFPVTEGFDSEDEAWNRLMALTMDLYDRRHTHLM